MINIYLRHSFYSPNSSLQNRFRPEWFDKKAIFKNLIKTIDSNICKIKIIYDTHFGDNSDIFFNEYNFDIIKVNCGTEASSFLKTLDIVLSDNLLDDDIIYFLEDDYLHRENWCEILKEGLSISDYVSLYDHLDKYLYYPDLNSKIYITKNSHWRTVPSTCNTYACKMSTLKKDINIHQHFSIINDNGISQDNSKFLSLGSIGRSLITPLPGYSTHCNDQQSPIIKWENFII